MLRDQNPFPLVLSTQPTVRGVRLADVNQEELNAVLVFVVQLIEGANLTPEWRSGVATEDKHNRFFAAEIRKSGFVFPVVCFQREVRRRISGNKLFRRWGFGRGGSGVRPGSLKRDERNESHDQEMDFFHYTTLFSILVPDVGQW